MRAEHRCVQGFLPRRLGLALGPDAWPSAATLKGWEAAGLGWAQATAPPVAVLRDRALSARHAEALRAVFATTTLRLVVAAPPDLRPGRADHDRALDGLLHHAAACGAELVVVPACDFAAASPPAILAEHLALEERALRGVAETGRRLGIRICLRNGAPAYPGALRVGHDPGAVAALADRLDAPAIRTMADVGHAHVVAGVTGRDLADVLAPVLRRAAIVAVHDNLGAHGAAPRPSGIDPVRLDLHLTPGEGTLPWARVAGLVSGLEVPVIVDLRSARADACAIARDVGRLLAGSGEAAAAA